MSVTDSLDSVIRNVEMLDTRVRAGESIFTVRAHLEAVLIDLRKLKEEVEGIGTIWVVAFGSPFSGMTLSGPFSSPELAAEHAESVDVPWEVIEIEPVNPRGG